MVSPILVALDFSDLGHARKLAESVIGGVAGFKVGLQLLTSAGPDAISEIAQLGAPVMVDAKLHDIPNTVGRAAHNIGARGGRWVTAHASGGVEMMAAAVSGMERGSGGGVLAVTVLTSLDQDDLEATGVSDPVEGQVTRLTTLSRHAGVEGVVCSVQEVGLVKSVAPDLIAVTPGIRLEGGGAHDQKRHSTPAEALASGADLLVVGRAITGAPDPAVAAAVINAELRGR